MDKQTWANKLEHYSPIHLLGPCPCHVGQQSTPCPPQAALILVDGGANHYNDSAHWQSYRHVFWAGDGDSCQKIPQEKVLVQWDEKKDFSDLEGVLRNLAPHHLELSLWGFWGEAQAYHMANLGDLHRYTKSRPQSKALLYGPDGTLKASAFGPGRHQIEIQGAFHLLTIESTQIRLMGQCQYLIDPPKMVKSCSSLGLSNKGQGLVEIHSGGAFYIFF